MAMMDADPLAQLRDVHVPPDLSWWPPAIGWWIVMLAILAMLAWMLWQLRGRHQRRAPLRAAQRLLQELIAEQSQGHISDADFVHQSNELLKRVLVRAYGHTEYAPLAGTAWLQVLDDISETESFTKGSGKVLGDERFRAKPEVNIATLTPELERLLSKIRP